MCVGSSVTMLTASERSRRERLPAFVLPWARLTVRLCEALQSLGLATCGELGTRLAERLAIQTSPTTILRRIMVLPTAAREQVSELGIDDFGATRKVACVAVRTHERRLLPGVLPPSAD